MSCCTCADRQEDAIGHKHRIHNLDSFFISPCTSDEISILIQSLKLGKSSGPNSIPIKVLKIIGTPVSTDILLLINESFVSGTFPEKLKIAKVVPIFKKGITSMTTNYRPISLLSIFSKLFEKTMHQRLYNFLESCEILFCMHFCLPFLLINVLLIFVLSLSQDFQS